MRRKDREVTDINIIRFILDSSKVLHLGLSDCSDPYIVPMNYGYRLDSCKLTIYVHSATEGRKIDIIKKNPSCCIEMECETALIESNIACKYSYSFYSLEGFGKAVIVDDVKEKIEAMKLFMKQQTGKDFEFTDEMVAKVNVIRIDCENFTSKHRAVN